MQTMKDRFGDTWQHAYGNMWHKQRQVSYDQPIDKTNLKSKTVLVQGNTTTLKHVDSIWWR